MCKYCSKGVIHDDVYDSIITLQDFQDYIESQKIPYFIVELNQSTKYHYIDISVPKAVCDKKVEKMIEDILDRKMFTVGISIHNNLTLCKLLLHYIWRF